MHSKTTHNLLPTLWHVPFAGLQTVKPHQPYWYDNHRRTPHQCITLQISLQGSIVFKDNDKIYKVPPNHLLIFVFGEPTSYGRPNLTHPTQPYQNLWLNLAGVGLLEHINLFRNRFSPVINLSSDTSFIDKMQHIYRIANPQQRTPTTIIAQQIHNYINDLFIFAESQRATEQSPVERAIDLIINQPTYPWSLKSLAASLGCSREHLTRHFTDRIGVPPATYLKNIRVKRAIQLLENSSLSLKQIAHTLGYTSTHTFARQIKQHTGLSPIQYRNK